MKVFQAESSRLLILVIVLATAVIGSRSVFAVDCIPADITLTSQADVTSFQGTYGSGGICDTVTGVLTISGIDIVDLSPLSDLTGIGENSSRYGLVISNNPLLTNLDGLSSLASISGAITIESNNALANLDGLSSLTATGYNLVISQNSTLSDLSGLSNITSISGQLNLGNNSSLPNVDGLSALSNVDGDIQIYQNSALTNISGLSALSSLGSYLIVSNNPLLTSLDGLSALTHIGIGGFGFGLDISTNASLSSLDGLSSLTGIDGGLTLWGNPKLTDVDGLLSLNRVGGKVTINLNNLLANTDGLVSLTSVGNDFQLTNNPVLSSCSSLARLLNTIDDGDPGPGPGVAGIPDVGGDATLSGNAPGCNTLAEILPKPLPVDPNGFEIISSDSFEGTTVLDTVVNTVLAPLESIASSGITVTATGGSDATVVISNALDENQQPGIYVEIEGGAITLDLNDPVTQTLGAEAAVEFSLCPDPESTTYPIKYCVGGKTANLATIGYPTDHIISARIPTPGTQLAEKTPFLGFRTIFIQKNVVVSFYKSSCQSFTACPGEPVLLVHGYQMELLGYNLADNGGRNYWGYFPERLSAAGYQPFEFIWHTNARFKDVAADLASAISDINLQTGRKVHIVAHSFGGILTRRLLQDPDVNGVAALIASVTTIGTPHLGIFDSETTYGGITFPGGQDSVLFEGHSQISAHLMGENAFGSHIASLLGFSGSPGEEAYFLASNISLLPPLNFLNLPGFTQFLNQYRFVGPGDNLLTAETQRFLTDFVFSGGNPAWQLFADSGNYPIGAATVTEYALGRRIGSDHDMELRPGQQVSISDFVEYKHSKATPGGTLGGALASEPYVPESGYHDGYQRVIEWLTANGSPAISALPLNDTGIDWGGNYPSGNNATCTGETIAAQDCSHGRDATHNDDADGHAGFSFTKLDSNGNALSASASTWSCVRDEVTGLTWEAKTNDGGLQDTDNTYTWYNPDSSTNGGNSGTQNGGSCSGSDCDTYGYVQAVNAEAQALCGARDWRMPWREELRSIVDYGRTIPAIDTVFFPNQRSSGVWSGSPGASGYAWGVGFGYGGDYGDNRSSNSQVRLVRGGQ